MKFVTVLYVIYKSDEKHISKTERNGKYMKTYKVNITESYSRTIEVKAEDEYDAYDKVDAMVNDGEIDLPCDGGSYDYKRELDVNELKL